MNVMDAAGSWGIQPLQITAQKAQAVQSEVGVRMLDKAMKLDEQSVADIIGALPNADAKAAELSVNPYVGSLFDMSI